VDVQLPWKVEVGTVSKKLALLKCLREGQTPHCMHYLTSTEFLKPHTCDKTPASSVTGRPGMVSLRTWQYKISYTMVAIEL